MKKLLSKTLFIWTEVRYRFLRALRQLSGVPEGAVRPRWIVFIYYILFPLNWCYERNANIKYDALHDIYTIQGMKFSGEVFRHFRQSIGEKFEIVDTDDGTVTLRRITGYEFFIDKVCKN